MTVERTRSFRAISVRAALGYLESVGGEQVGDTRVEGDGWTATLSSEKVTVGPSMRLTETTVEFEGDSAELLDPVIERFAQKAIRAGG